MGKISIPNMSKTTKYTYCVKINKFSITYLVTLHLPPFVLKVNQKLPLCCSMSIAINPSTFGNIF